MRESRHPILKTAVQLSMLNMPVLFLSDLIDAKDSSASIGILFIFGILTTFFVLFSDSPKNALKKWGCSIPITLIFWFILGETHFYVRLLNTVLPGYGRPSAGAGLGLLMKFVSFTVARGISILLAIISSCPINGRHLQRLLFVVQDIILPIICVVVLIAVLYLEFTMPSWYTIYYSVYS